MKETLNFFVMGKNKFIIESLFQTKDKVFKRFENIFLIIPNIL